MAGPAFRGLAALPNRVVGDFLWISVGRVVTGIGSLLVIRALTHTLAPALYSELVLAVATVSLFVSVIAGPLSSAANRFFYDAQRAGHQVELRITLWLGMGLMTVVGGAAMACLWPLFGVGAVGSLALLALLAYLASTVFLTLAQSVLNISLHRREVSILIALGSLSGPLGALGASVQWGQTLPVLLGGYAYGGAFALALAIVFLARSGELPASASIPRASRTLFREMLMFGWPIALGSVSSWLMSVSDRFLINAMVPNPEAVAFYAIAYQAGSFLPQIVSAVFITLAAPYIMRSYLPKSGQMPNIEMWAGTLSWITLPCLALTIVFSKGLVLLLAPEPYLVAQSVVPYPAIALAFYPIYQVISNVYHLRKRLLAPTLFSLFAGCLRVGLNLLLIPRIGITGAALTTLGTYMLEMTLGLTVAARLIRWRFPWKWIALGAAATALGITGVAIVRTMLPVSPQWTGDLLLATVFCLVYLPALGIGIALFRRHFSFAHTIHDVELLAGSAP